MNKWQVNIKIWQDDIKIWQDDIKIWQVNIIIWQEMAEICHHSHHILLKYMSSNNFRSVSHPEHLTVHPTKDRYVMTIDQASTSWNCPRLKTYFFHWFKTLNIENAKNMFVCLKFPPHYFIDMKFQLSIYDK